MPYTLSKQSKYKAAFIDGLGREEILCYKGSYGIWRMFTNTDPKRSLPGEYPSATVAFKAFLRYGGDNLKNVVAELKDRRYKMAKKLIAVNEIKGLRELIEIIPRSVFARDLHMTNLRLVKLMFKVEDFLMKDLFRIAELIEVDEMEIIRLVHAQYVADQKEDTLKNFI